MITALVILAAALPFLWYLRRRYVLVTVRGHSMMPAYRDGQRILVRRIGGRRLRPGDVAVFPTPTGAAAPGAPAWLVKRVTAVAGDRVPPELLESPRVELIPQGHCVVRGDNPHSLDSRHFGYLAERSVLGVVCAPRR